MLTCALQLKAKLKKNNNKIKLFWYTTYLTEKKKKFC